MVQGPRKQLKGTSNVIIFKQRKNAPKPRKAITVTGSNSLKQQAKKVLDMKQKLTKAIHKDIEEVMLSRAATGMGTKLQVLKSDLTTCQISSNKKKLPLSH
jgi:hypothetical protein